MNKEKDKKTYKVTIVDAEGNSETIETEGYESKFIYRNPDDKFCKNEPITHDFWTLDLKDLKPETCCGDPNCQQFSCRKRDGCSDECIKIDLSYDKENNVSLKVPLSLIYDADKDVFLENIKQLAENLYDDLNGRIL